MNVSGGLGAERKNNNELMLTGVAGASLQARNSDARASGSRTT
jgi:hypothetical protein